MSIEGEKGMKVYELKELVEEYAKLLEEIEAKIEQLRKLNRRINIEVKKLDWHKPSAGGMWIKKKKEYSFPW